MISLAFRKLKVVNKVREGFVFVFEIVSDGVFVSVIDKGKEVRYFFYR